MRNPDHCIQAIYVYVGGGEDENGENSKVHVRHRGGLWEAREETMHCKTEVEDAT